MNSDKDLNLGLHIALIMDGNGRWATKQSLRRSKGHQQGALNMLKLLEDLPSSVSIVTAYAFSTENWSRSITEIYGLFAAAKEFFHHYTQTLIKLGFKVQFLGDLHLVPGFIRSSMWEIEEATRHGTRGLFNLAVSYGSRQEIVKAAEKIHQKGEKIDVNTFGKYLNTCDIKDPDMLIRTGGEKRLSNYLLWQLAYAELFFVDTLWPDFTIDDLNAIIKEYSGRNRSFGYA